MAMGKARAFHNKGSMITSGSGTTSSGGKGAKRFMSGKGVMGGATSNMVTMKMPKMQKDMSSKPIKGF